MGSRELADKNMVVPAVEKSKYVTDLGKLPNNKQVQKLINS